MILSKAIDFALYQQGSDRFIRDLGTKKILASGCDRSWVWILWCFSDRAS